jgi:hypothetical protein
LSSPTVPGGALAASSLRVFTCLQNVDELAPYWGDHLQFTLRCHAKTLCFDAIARNRKVHVKPNASCDPRVISLLGTVFPSRLSTREGFVKVDAPACAHALRVSARCNVVRQRLNPKGADTSGADRIGLHLRSQKQWKTFMKSLSSGDPTRIGYWRGGAVRTPPRRPYRGDAPPVCAHRQLRTTSNHALGKTMS